LRKKELKNFNKFLEIGGVITVLKGKKWWYFFKNFYKNVYTHKKNVYLHKSRYRLKSPISIVNPRLSLNCVFSSQKQALHGLWFGIKTYDISLLSPACDLKWSCRWSTSGTNQTQLTHSPETFPSNTFSFV
jgi:hypothetical protein